MTSTDDSFRDFDDCISKLYAVFSSYKPDKDDFLLYPYLSDMFPGALRKMTKEQVNAASRQGTSSLQSRKALLPRRIELAFQIDGEIWEIVTSIQSDNWNTWPIEEQEAIKEACFSWFIEQLGLLHEKQFPSSHAANLLGVYINEKFEVDISPYLRAVETTDSVECSTSIAIMILHNPLRVFLGHWLTANSRNVVSTLRKSLSYWSTCENAPEGLEKQIADCCRVAIDYLEQDWRASLSPICVPKEFRKNVASSPPGLSRRIKRHILTGVDDQAGSDEQQDVYHVPLREIRTKHLANRIRELYDVFGGYHPQEAVRSLIDTGRSPWPDVVKHLTYADLFCLSLKCGLDMSRQDKKSLFPRELELCIRGGGDSLKNVMLFLDINSWISTWNTNERQSIENCLLAWFCEAIDCWYDGRECPTIAASMFHDLVRYNYQGSILPYFAELNSRDTIACGTTIAGLICSLHLEVHFGRWVCANIDPFLARLRIAHAVWSADTKYESYKNSCDEAIRVLETIIAPNGPEK